MLEQLRNIEYSDAVWFEMIIYDRIMNYDIIVI